MNEHRKAIEAYKQILRYCRKRDCGNCVFSSAENTGSYCCLNEEYELIELEDRANELERGMRGGSPALRHKGHAAGRSRPDRGGPPRRRI